MSYGNRSLKKMQTRSKVRADGFKIVAKFGMHYIHGNNLPYFSITGTTYSPDHGGGCIHDELVAAWPDLAELVPWHLADQNGAPMHYPANAVYLACDRDCWGMRKGEFKQTVSRKSGLPMWTPNLPDGIRPYSTIEAESAPDPLVIEWIPYGRTGEGKDRELDAARHSANWPDATDAELCADDLESRLLARLPELRARFLDIMARFKVELISPEETGGES